MPIGEGSLELLTQQDCDHIATICAPSRRAEQVAWRTALRALIGTEAEVVYLPSGAPSLTANKWQISVSHNAGWGAVAVGEHRCGIDIESISRNFERVAARYISTAEEALPESSHTLFRVLLWSAKEAIYKYLSLSGIDFLEDIRITSTDIGNRKLQAEFRGVALPEVEFRIIEEQSVLCIIRDKA